MRFMIIVKATKDSEAAVMPTDAQLLEMAEYHEELHRAGVVLDAGGLRPSREGFRVHYTEGKRTVVDGPFSETKEMIGGYTIIQVKSADEAKAWARRFPNPFPGTAEGVYIEVRRLFELDDFVAGAGLEKWRELGIGAGPSQPPS